MADRRAASSTRIVPTTFTSAPRSGSATTRGTWSAARWTIRVIPFSATSSSSTPAAVRSAVTYDQPVQELGSDDPLDPQRPRGDVGGDDGQPRLQQVAHDPGADASFAAGDEEPLGALRHRSESIMRNPARM